MICLHILISSRLKFQFSSLSKQTCCAPYYTTKYVSILKFALTNLLYLLPYYTTEHNKPNQFCQLITHISYRILLCTQEHLILPQSTHGSLLSLLSLLVSIPYRAVTVS